MAYEVTVYFKDQYIESTHIECSPIYIDDTRYYGDEDYHTNIPDYPVKFTAQPADGCEFTKWVYQLGEITLDGQIESTDNPFTYRGDQNIFIRAVGSPTGSGGGTDDTTIHLGQINDQKTSSGTFSNWYEVICWDMTFAESGKATFTVNCPYSATIFLSDDSRTDEDGLPEKRLAEDGKDLIITYDVKANTTYYIYAILDTNKKNVNVTLTVTAPYNDTEKELASILPATRIDGGLIINWKTAKDATNYRIKLVRAYDSYSITNTAAAPPYTWTGLMYGVTYNLSIDTYNDGWLGYCATVPITTAPAQPRLTSVTQKDGVITVNWELVDESNISGVHINLWDASNTEILQTKLIKNQTSGSFSYSKVDDGTYHIHASSYLSVNNTDIYSVDDDGVAFILDYSVSVGNKPELWEWEEIYTLSTGGTGTICANAYIPVDKNGLHPCTYQEWNRFVAKVNEVREWASSLGITVTGSDLSKVGQYGDFATAYKAAVKSIQGIQGCGTLLQDDYPVQLTSSLFVGTGSLQAELNDIINKN